MAEHNKHITCQRCGADFGARTKKPKASARQPFRLTDTDYIVHFCAAVELDTPCWVWRWSRIGNGYADIRRNYRHLMVCRLVLGIVDKPQFEYECLHACDNPPCVNPAHLRVGTRTDNVEDAVSKGRMPNQQGAGNYNAKLTEADVLTIRRMASSDTPKVEIAEAFGISLIHLYEIQTGKAWRHLLGGKERR